MKLLQILFIFLFIIIICCVCTPNRLSCGTVGSATSASSHGNIGSSSDTLTLSETNGGSSISRAYVPGETLYVGLSTSASQYSIELSSGTFDSGSSCGGKRKLNGMNLFIYVLV